MCVALLQPVASDAATGQPARHSISPKTSGGWRHQFAKSFVAHANAREWRWIERRTKKSEREYVLDYAKDARRRGKMRAADCHAGSYYSAAPRKSSGFCYVPVKVKWDWWYFVSFRRHHGKVQIDGFGLED